MDRGGVRDFKVYPALLRRLDRVVFEGPWDGLGEVERYQVNVEIQQCLRERRFVGRLHCDDVILASRMGAVVYALSHAGVVQRQSQPAQDLQAPSARPSSAYHPSGADGGGDASRFFFFANNIPKGVRDVKGMIGPIPFQVADIFEQFRDGVDLKCKYFSPKGSKDYLHV